MSHDPLCKHRSARMPVNGCPSCDEIANIRADEREKAAQRVERGVLGIDGIIFGCPFCGDPWESEPSCEHWPVIERLAAAVRGES